ncbi:MAG: polysaccharide biosynthesis protein [Acidobacteriota bacterium]|nr:polysaccharide biosynthesis protein [Acidobacteriota bacterium]
MGQTAGLSSNIFTDRALIQFEGAGAASAVVGKKIMITGAGGSVGSALAREILSFEPSSLLLLEHSENNLFQIEKALFENPAGSRVVSFLGDVNDELLLDEIFERHGPQLVFHAAAFKHVPLLENHPLSAIQNNVVGTHSLAKKSVQHHALRVVMLSTDKAVNPSSIMGASKRIAELILRAMSTPETTMLSVRFGNVIGSRGSVFPLFAEQIKLRRPLTVTHPEATRYFLNLSEAVNLVLQAVWLGSGGDILVPELGRPVKILHVAEQLIHQSGLLPDVDLPIVFTGLRPGEKMHEELISDNEVAGQTEIKGIRKIAQPAVSLIEVERWLTGLQESLKRRNVSALVEEVCRIVPEYRPSPAVLESGRAKKLERQ